VTTFLEPVIPPHVSTTIAAQTLSLRDLDADVEIRVDPTITDIRLWHDAVPGQLRVFVNVHQGLVITRHKGDVYDRGGCSVLYAGDDTLMAAATLMLSTDIEASPGAYTPSPLRIVLDVPPHLPLWVHGTGNFRIGDTHGPLIVRLNAGSVRAGAVTAPDIYLNTGSVHIASIAAPDYAVLEIAGTGLIHVAAGTANTLRAALSGLGRIFFNGTAERADLKSLGAGHIGVDRVTGMMSRQVTGAAAILVRHEGAA
jgi:hypothetical protein